MRVRAEFLLAAGLLLAPASIAAQEGSAEAGVRAAIEGYYAALEAEDTEAAGGWLAPEFFAITPWGTLEFREEGLARYREAFDEKRLQHYRAEVRAVHTGPAGEGARWFRAIVREKYQRDTGRRARNAFAEDLLTSGVAIRRVGRWHLRFLQQTWSDETLRRMIPILHAAQPVDPEEY